MPAYRAGYPEMVGYQGHPAYQGQPVYQGQPAYGTQADYQADYPVEPGYQDAFDGIADREYRDYQPTRVIDSPPAAPDGYA